MKKILLLSMLLYASLIIFGQKKIRADLTGKISDAKTGQPLSGASVLIVDSKVGTSTDSNGVYRFRNITSGHSMIEISYEGYRSVVEHLDINGDMQKDYTLTPSVIENEGVTITAVGSATSIRKAPIPITRISHEELLSTPSTNIIDALRKQPGVNQITTGPAISKPTIRGLGL